MKWPGFFAFFLLLFPLIAEENLGLDSSTSQLFHDLQTVQQIDRELHHTLPFIINYHLQGGYFTMPSARSYPAGTFGFGYASVDPYNIWSLGLNFFDHIETTGNYWIYQNLLDNNFGILGFGNSAERAPNVKFILLRKEDGFPLLPEFAIGWNDFFGSQRFNSFYVVATKEILPLHLEASFGWGNGRIRGFFGGFAWTPWHRADHFLRKLSVVAEYDANDYQNHSAEHPEGRNVTSRINAGLQFDFLNLIRLSGSTLRGNTFAGSAALHYDLGASKGLFPKIFDVPTYTAPVDTQPLGVLRTREELAQELAYAFQEQGFDLYNLFLVPGKRDRLWMKVVNVRYREEAEVRKKVEYLLAALVPSNIPDATVVVEADGISEHEYQFRLQDLQQYAEGNMGDDEFRIVSPLHEASSTPSNYDGALLYEKHKRIWMLTFISLALFLYVALSVWTTLVAVAVLGNK